MSKVDGVGDMRLGKTVLYNNWSIDWSIWKRQPGLCAVTERAVAEVCDPFLVGKLDLFFQFCVQAVAGPPGVHAWVLEDH